MPTTQGSKHPTILLIYDTLHPLDLLLECLQALEIAVSIAHDCNVALRLAEALRPDLILLESTFAAGASLALCQQFKQHATLRHIPILFLTPVGDPAQQRQGFLAGGADYLAIPFQREELLARIPAYLALSQRSADGKQRDSRKDKFFSIISHDLQSPLATLRGLSEFIDHNLDAMGHAKIKESIRLIHNSIDNLYQLVDNLLIWARLQQGRFEYEPRLLDVRNIIVRNLKLFLPNADQKQITLTSSVMASCPLYVDENMFDSIIRNLISNALKFTHKGGTVNVSARQCDAMLEIAVTDTGIGMSQAELDKLFRIDTKHKELGTAREKGTGMGLILCHEFVEKSGGQIHVVSAVGQGSTFTVSFPCPLQNDSDLPTEQQ